MSQKIFFEPLPPTKPSLPRIPSTCDRPKPTKKNPKRNVLCDIAVSVSVVLAPPQHHPRVYKNEYE